MAEPLSTVDVPPPFAPIFARAQEFVARYFGERVEDPEHSTIRISGERYILVRAASMSVEFFDLVTSLYRGQGEAEARTVANNLLFDMAHAIGRADARAFHAKMGVTDPIERLSAGPIHFSFSGWAFVRIHPESQPSPDESFFLYYDHPFSFESDAWRRQGRKVDFPVCIMSSGYSSGWCEESFGVPLVAVEIACQARGDEHCRFVMAPPTRIEAHLERLRQGQPGVVPATPSREGGVIVPEFFQRKRLEEELRRSRDDLERRVAERTRELERELAQRRSLEAQLLQAQKMEGLGRLAGGVAHDFNNLLTVILSHAELAQAGLPSVDVRRDDIEQIAAAARRASGLTTQLLAFARRQIIAPVLVDLNALTGNVDAMLRRLIGEDIELITHPGPNLRLVRVDPGQFEQVLINLAVNARDAMPGGGRIEIATENVSIDPESIRPTGTVPFGRYVLLRVTDTGVGIPPETLERIFEPFFTTKAVGKGSGLGLAMVYGIVRQSGGFVEATSEIGQGTTFRLWLPAVEGSLPRLEVEPTAVPRGHEGQETILVVEDEAGVRDVAVRGLRARGYRVMVAGSGREAIEQVRQLGSQPLDLLVSDVVMPEMGGPELAERLRVLRPGLPVLFVSGYSDEVIDRQGVLRAGIAFLPKPYTPAALAERVRGALDGETGGAG